MKRSLVALLSVSLVACTDQVVTQPTPAAQAAVPADETEATPEETPTETPAATPTSATPPPPPAAPPCATTLGTAITAAHGRLDGTVRAVVVPGDFSCKGDNDHVIVQIDAGGATYAAWVNVESNIPNQDPVVRFADLHAPLPSGSGAWAAGWHPDDGSLDYASSLGVHTSDFTSTPKAALAQAIASAVPVGARVSAYIDGFSTGDGGHKVHRNGYGRDGALVVHEASGQPRWLLFHFVNQTF